MKFKDIAGIVLAALLLVGCTEVETKEKEPVEKTAHIEGLQSQVKTLKGKVEELTESHNQLAAEKEMFSTLSHLSNEFMVAIHTGDLDRLKKTVSDEFVIETKGEEWRYVMLEPIDTQRTALLYSPNLPNEYWELQYYGQIQDAYYLDGVPEKPEYGVSIRVYTKENIESGNASMINLHIKEVDGEWKIFAMDNYV